MRSFSERRARALQAAVLVVTTLATATAAGGKPPAAVPARPNDQTIRHVLNRITFGPRPGDIDRVRQMGLQAFIDQQLHPERIADSQIKARLASLTTLDKSTRELADEYFIPALEARQQAQAQAKKDQPADPSMQPPEQPKRTPEQMQAQQKQRQVIEELSTQKILRAAYSERQLEEVMTDFWFNHFNVFAGKGPTQVYLTEYERDAIRPHVLGKFRDLLEATATSPAMLFYLDNWQSADPNGPDPRDQRRPRLINGRGRFGGPFGRGGRFGIFPPPPVRQAPQGAAAQQRPKRGLNENDARELMELHTLGVDGGYTQQDVIEVARCFTGWTIQAPRQGGGFRFEPRMHDRGEKVVLGHKIKAGGEREDGEQVLDILANHPSTARFVATKLARRFVSDNPPQALLNEAAARFRETHGDIREVLRAILTSKAFFSADAYRAKVKTPFEFVVSAVRATNVDVSNALPLVQAVRQLGMPLYFCQPPTGYADRSDAWVNTGALLNRMNFSLALVSGRMRGIAPPVTADAAANSPDAVRGHLLAAVLADEVSPATRDTLAKAQDPRQVLALTLGSPEFQRK